MKKLMTIVLGLSFLTGVVALAEEKTTEKKADKKKAGKKGKKDEKTEKKS